MLRNWSVTLTAAAALCVGLASPTHAVAQEQETVSAQGKGIVGGALLGSEVVMLTEAAIGAKPWWAYLVGGVAGAAGGGVGGYFVEQGDAKISLYLLAGGMALAIPTTVAVLSQTAYEPPVDYTQDSGPTDEPAPEPAAPDATVGDGTKAEQPQARQMPPAPSPPSFAMAPPSLIGVRSGTFALSVPAVEVRDSFSRREVQQFGVRQGTEVRVPVLKVWF